MPILTLDVDGVIAAMSECDHTPSLRTWTAYRSKAPHPNLDLTILNRLLSLYHVYFVSARSFEGASDCTREWLREIGVEVDRALGVICTEGLGLTHPQGGCASWAKPQLLEWLGSTLHIDDHPGIIYTLKPPTLGVLFRNDSYEANIRMYESDGPWMRAEDWPTIETLVSDVWTATSKARQ